MKSALSRAVAVVFGTVLVLVAVAGVSQAGHDEDAVTNLTGCLTPGGDFKNMTFGNSPSKPCSSNDRAIHLSSGDITAVTAGSGLTGGATEGDAQLSLAAGYALPQGCSIDQVAKMSAGGGWQCRPDNDTTYTGANFALSNQACTAGQVVTGVNSAGLPVCATDKDTTYSGTNFAKSGAACPAGKYVSGISTTGDLVCNDLPVATTPTLDVVTVTDQQSIGAASSGAAAAACPEGYKLVGGGWAAHDVPVSGAGYYQFEGANTYSTRTGLSIIPGTVSARAFCARIS